MQHVDEYLKRYEPVLKVDNYTLLLDTWMNETPKGRYVKYEDVKSFLELIAKKVRMF